MGAGAAQCCGQERERVETGVPLGLVSRSQGPHLCNYKQRAALCRVPVTTHPQPLLWASLPPPSNARPFSTLLARAAAHPAHVVVLLELEPREGRRQRQRQRLACAGARKEAPRAACAQGGSDGGLVCAHGKTERHVLCGAPNAVQCGPAPHAQRRCNQRGGPRRGAWRPTHNECTRPHCKNQRQLGS